MVQAGPGWSRLIQAGPGWFSRFRLDHDGPGWTGLVKPTVTVSRSVICQHTQGHIADWAPTAAPIGPWPPGAAIIVSCGAARKTRSRQIGLGRGVYNGTLPARPNSVRPKNVSERDSNQDDFVQKQTTISSVEKLVELT